MKKEDFYQAIGRRKESTARVRLYLAAKSPVDIGGISLKKGDILVNGRPVAEYFPGQVYKNMYLALLKLVESEGRYAVSVKVEGGGLKGQLGALLHGLARAFNIIDKDKYRAILKKEGYLTRDDRKKQRRKAGFAQKSRAKKQSPKR